MIPPSSSRRGAFHPRSNSSARRSRRRHDDHPAVVSSTTIASRCERSSDEERSQSSAHPANHIPRAARTPFRLRRPRSFSRRVGPRRRHRERVLSPASESIDLQPPADSERRSTANFAGASFVCKTCRSRRNRTTTAPQAQGGWRSPASLHPKASRTPFDQPNWIQDP